MSAQEGATARRAALTTSAKCCRGRFRRRAAARFKRSSAASHDGCDPLDTLPIRRASVSSGGPLRARRLCSGLSSALARTAHEARRRACPPASGPGRTPRWRGLIVPRRSSASSRRVWRTCATASPSLGKGRGWYGVAMVRSLGDQRSAGNSCRLQMVSTVVAATASVRLSQMPRSPASHAACASTSRRSPT